MRAFVPVITIAHFVSVLGRLSSFDTSASLRAIDSTASLPRSEFGGVLDYQRLESLIDEADAKLEEDEDVSLDDGFDIETSEPSLFDRDLHLEPRSAEPMRPVPIANIFKMPLKKVKEPRRPPTYMPNLPTEALSRTQSNRIGHTLSAQPSEVTVSRHQSPPTPSFFRPNQAGEPGLRLSATHRHGTAAGDHPVLPSPFSGVNSHRRPLPSKEQIERLGRAPSAGQSNKPPIKRLRADKIRPAKSFPKSPDHIPGPKKDDHGKEAIQKMHEDLRKWRKDFKGLPKQPGPRRSRRQTHADNQVHHKRPGSSRRKAEPRIHRTKSGRLTPITEHETVKAPQKGKVPGENDRLQPHHQIQEHPPIPALKLDSPGGTKKHPLNSHSLSDNRFRDRLSSAQSVDTPIKGLSQTTLQPSSRRHSRHSSHYSSIHSSGHSSGHSSEHSSGRSSPISSHTGSFKTASPHSLDLNRIPHQHEQVSSPVDQQTHNQDHFTFSHPGGSPDLVVNQNLGLTRKPSNPKLTQKPSSLGLERTDSIEESRPSQASGNGNSRTPTPFKSPSQLQRQKQSRFYGDMSPPNKYGLDPKILAGPVSSGKGKSSYSRSDSGSAQYQQNYQYRHQQQQQSRRNEEVFRDKINKSKKERMKDKYLAEVAELRARRERSEGLGKDGSKLSPVFSIIAHQLIL